MSQSTALFRITGLNSMMAEKEKNQPQSACFKNLRLTFLI
jgi:hypothetical protein